LLRIWSQTARPWCSSRTATEAVYRRRGARHVGAAGAHHRRIDITLPLPRPYEMMATDVFGRLRERIWQQIRKAT
jgi:NitT/TauT family transport system ATP-binding protein